MQDVWINYFLPEEKLLNTLLIFQNMFLIKVNIQFVITL